jgi:hypothetical protein
MSTREEIWTTRLHAAVDDHPDALAFDVPSYVVAGRKRARRNRGLLAGGVALAVASVVAAGSMVTGQRSADRPQPAERPGLTTPLVAPASLLDVREFGFHIDPLSDVVQMDSWAIERDRQSTHIEVFGDDGVGTYWDVAVYYQGESPALTATGTTEAVTVNGAVGTYVEESRPNDWEAHLAWEYAPDSWAVVFARGEPAPPSDLRSNMLTVAEAVRAGGEPVRIPVRLGTMPASLPPVTTAHGVNVTYDQEGGGWSYWLSFNDDISLWATPRTGTDCDGHDDGSPYTANFTYRGHSGCLVDGERIGLRRGSANVFMDYGAADPGAKPSTSDMKHVLADLTVASEDPATWFDLATALGG